METETEKESLLRLEKDLHETTGKKPKGMGQKFKMPKPEGGGFQKLTGPDGPPAHAVNVRKNKGRKR
jgi:hypothetical protein